MLKPLLSRPLKLTNNSTTPSGPAVYYPPQSGSHGNQRQSSNGYIGSKAGEFEMKTFHGSNTTHHASTIIETREIDTESEEEFIIQCHRHKGRS